jgi:MFS family permease
MPLAYGVVAAACLGKIAPIAGSVRDAFGLTATWLGAAISAITFVTAALAAPVGEWLRHRDPIRWLAAGLMVMAVAGAAMIGSTSPIVLICLRLVEGVGYLLVMVGGPVMLVTRVAERQQPLALALWGGCIPAGLALGATAGGEIGSRWGWQWWFAAVAFICAALALVAFFVPPAPSRTQPAPDRPGRSPGRRGVWAAPLLLAGGFSAVALVSVAVLSVFPEYLHSELGMSTTAAGVATSVAAVASVPGNVCAGVLLRHGVRAQVLVSAGLLSAALAALTFSMTISVGVTIAGAVLLLFTVGVAVAAAYGSLPLVVRHTDDLPLANGILVQLGSVGTLIGPPVFATVTGLQRWHLVPYLVLLSAGVGVLLVIRAISAGRAQMRPQPSPRTPDSATPTHAPAVREVSLADLREEEEDHDAAARPS